MKKSGICGVLMLVNASAAMAHDEAQQQDRDFWYAQTSVYTLHFSPDARVNQKVIESATLLGRDDVALAHLARFRAAFPREQKQWAEDNRRVLEGAQTQLRAASEAADLNEKGR